MEKNTDGLERVVEAARADMLALAQRYVGHSDAEDCVQDAIVEALGSEGVVEKASLLRGVERACERVRGRRRRSRDVSVEGIGEACVPTSRGQSEDEIAALMAAASLTGLQRICLQGRLDGVKTREIAEELCISPRMVQYHLKACGPHLRRLNVQDLGFSSAQAMFDYCAHQYVYHAPTRAGSALANERQSRLK